jgi:hypothetical protein
MNRRLVFVGSLLTQGKLAFERRKNGSKLKERGQVESREFSVHLRTETTSF